MVACEPIYRDILILKKDKKAKAVVKLCFECSMIDSYGKINSNVKKVAEKDFDLYMKNFQKLHTLLHNSDSKADK